jgi:hypothetical protein
MDTKQLIDYLESYIDVTLDALHQDDVRSGAYAEAYLKGSLDTAKLILGKVDVHEEE